MLNASFDVKEIIAFTYYSSALNVPMEAFIQLNTFAGIHSIMLKYMPQTVYVSKEYLDIHMSLTKKPDMMAVIKTLKKGN